MDTCHTWPSRRDDGTDVWMACQGCFSAWWWYCIEDECDWTWTQGLNPRNPRAEANAAKAPTWEGWDFL